MTNFWRRLKYYGIGFGIGLIFVFFFFRNRGCSWTPSNRVKNAILDRVLVITDDTKEQLKAQKLSEDYLVNVLNDGEVNFRESDKDGESKVYQIEKEGKSFLFTLPAESFISEVKIGKNASGAKNSTNGEGYLIHFPKDEDLVFVDSSLVLGCQLEALGLINQRDILKELKKTGKILFEKSDLTLRPKPEHYLLFERKGKMVGAKVIWYKNKLNIHAFEYEGDECGR